MTVKIFPTDPPPPEKPPPRTDAERLAKITLSGDPMPLLPIAALKASPKRQVTEEQRRREKELARKAMALQLGVERPSWFERHLSIVWIIALLILLALMFLGRHH